MNFDNQLAFVKVRGKSKVAPFFQTWCSVTQHVNPFNLIFQGHMLPLSQASPYGYVTQNL